MRRSLLAMGWCVWMLSLPAFALAQKGDLKGSESSGKSEITGGSSPKSWSEPSHSSSSNHSESNSSRSDHSESNHSSSSSDYSSGSSSYSSESEPEPKPRRSHRSETHESNTVSESNWSSPGESAPKPVHSAPQAEPRPNYYHSSWEASSPSQTGEPKVNTASSPSGGATQLSDGRTVIFDAEGPRTEGMAEKPLPGLRPDPLPPPPGGWSTEMTGEETGSGDAEGVDSLTPGQLGGTVLSAPPRPNFSRDTLFNNPSTIQPGRPKGEPKPKPVPGGYPTTGGGDPYSQCTNLNLFFSFSSTSYYYGGGVGIAPELACIYSTADALESLYLSPNWCVVGFMEKYDVLLDDFLHCYNALHPNLEEPWMYQALLTYQDERKFWAEECLFGNLELQGIRDFLREKAAYVPYLMPKVDAARTEDWAYVDTAFAAPMGGYNYYRTMKGYDPSTVVILVNEWAGKYPGILIWPSYERVAGFHSRYFRSPFWALLRNKVKIDLERAQVTLGTDEEKAYQLAENAGWLCAAMLAVEPQEKEMIQVRSEIKALLKSRPGRWANHPLASVLN